MAIKYSNEKVGTLKVRVPKPEVQLKENVGHKQLGDIFLRLLVDAISWGVGSALTLLTGGGSLLAVAGETIANAIGNIGVTRLYDKQGGLLNNFLDIFPAGLVGFGKVVRGSIKTIEVAPKDLNRLSGIVDKVGDTKNLTIFEAKKFIYQTNKYLKTARLDLQDNKSLIEFTNYVNNQLTTKQATGTFELLKDYYKQVKEVQAVYKYGMKATEYLDTANKLLGWLDPYTAFNRLAQRGIKDIKKELVPKIDAFFEKHFPIIRNNIIKSYEFLKENTITGRRLIERLTRKFGFVPVNSKLIFGIRWIQGLAPDVGTIIIIFKTQLHNPRIVYNVNKIIYYRFLASVPDTPRGAGEIWINTYARSRGGAKLSTTFSRLGSTGAPSEAYALYNKIQRFYTLVKKDVKNFTQLTMALEQRKAPFKRFEQKITLDLERAYRPLSRIITLYKKFEKAKSPNTIASYILEKRVRKISRKVAIRNGGITRRKLATQIKRLNAPFLPKINEKK